jgi:ATPase subunit of ABC transporter with duplicated ATPase domains
MVTFRQVLATKAMKKNLKEFLVSEQEKEREQKQERESERAREKSREQEQEREQNQESESKSKSKKCLSSSMRHGCTDPIQAPFSGIGHHVLNGQPADYSPRCVRAVAHSSHEYRKYAPHK